MNIHEFQAKQILQSLGIPVPPFEVASSKEEVLHLLNQMGLNQAVIKIQVHAGGRGKGGGVKIGKNRQEILDFSEKLLGMRLVNSQTGKEGMVANQLLISPLIDFQKESYVAAVIDRQKAQSVLILSPVGGMDIEEIAARHPDSILTLPIQPQGKLRSYHIIQAIKFMGWKGKTADIGKKILQALANAFVELDALLVEINPLIETASSELWALDAKVVIDDNALFRQPKLASFYDPTQLSVFEARAHEYELAYIALEGNIGCMVNGAGLAMATMDIIHYYGGEAANFLDVGGGATESKIAVGFDILLSDPKVKAILVNIFGGIMSCVTLAQGILTAAKGRKLHVPLIVRMEGTEVEDGRKLLQNSGLNILIAKSLDDAARQAVTAVKNG